MSTQGSTLRGWFFTDMDSIERDKFKCEQKEWNMHYHEDGQTQHPTSTPSGSFWGSRTFFVFLGFSAIALVMLVSEHRAHFLGILPFVLLFACPLLHVFGHGHHGGGGGHDEERSSAPQEVDKQ